MDEADDFLRFLQVVDGGSWEWERGHARDCAAASVRDSALGQDGLLSSAFWAGAPQFAQDMLDSMAEAAQDGRGLARSFKASVMVAIPKSEVLEDARLRIDAAPRR